MPESTTSRTMSIDELAQRAVRAWNGLGGARTEPLGVETLQEETTRSVFRLQGAGPAGSAVVAKRCPRVVALKEFFVYADLLPRLPFPSVRVHGFVAEAGGDYAWLFMEDAAGEPYDPHREDHRAAAGHWLGLMHTAAADLTPPTELPDRGPAHFRRDLQAACDTIELTRVNPALTADDLTLLENILFHCRLLAAHWDELEGFCSRMPRTLVHADFKEAHIHMRRDPDGLSPLLFDWHEAGWGVPVLDVAKFLGYSVDPDLAAYGAVVKDRWPALDLATIRRLGFVGEACRCVASTRWEVERLRYPWVEGPMATLRVYLDWMSDVVRAEPWAENAALGPRARLPKPRTWF